MVANEWKDENDKVMPVKQWLEQRRVLQVFFLVNVIVHQIFSKSKFRKKIPLMQGNQSSLSQYSQPPLGTQVYKFSDSKHVWLSFLYFVGRDATVKGQTSNIREDS